MTQQVPAAKTLRFALFVVARVFNEMPQIFFQSVYSSPKYILYSLEKDGNKSKSITPLFQLCIQSKVKGGLGIILALYWNKRT